MSNIQISTMLATTAVLALAACGGGGNTFDQFEVTPERVFTDGGGVLRAGRTNGGTVLTIANNIGELIDYAQTNNTFEGSSNTNLSIVRILPTNANLRQGAINVGSLVGNVTNVEDFGGKAEIILVEYPNEFGFLMAGGAKFGSSPVGVLTYNGTFITGFRDIDPQIEYGDFSLNANFSNRTFMINGSNDYDTLSGSGSINISTGTLISNSLTMNTQGVDRTASLYGSLHGDSAESVSGLFHSNAAGQYYIGAFVGSR